MVPEDPAAQGQVAKIHRSQAHQGHHGQVLPAGQGVAQGQPPGSQGGYEQGAVGAVGAGEEAYPQADRELERPVAFGLVLLLQGRFIPP